MNGHVYVSHNTYEISLKFDMKYFHYLRLIIRNLSNLHELQRKLVVILCMHYKVNHFQGCSKT
jgi:hypothetical protein